VMTPEEMGKNIAFDLGRLQKVWDLCTMLDTSKAEKTSVTDIASERRNEFRTPPKLPIARRSHDPTCDGSVPSMQQDESEVYLSTPGKVERRLFGQECATNVAIKCRNVPACQRSKETMVRL